MKLVLMKYLNSRSLPCYRRITEEEIPESDNDRLEMMELKKASGVETAVFCHTAGFFAVAKTKEDAISLAEKAVNS